MEIHFTPKPLVELFSSRRQKTELYTQKFFQMNIFDLVVRKDIFPKRPESVIYVSTDSFVLAAIFSRIYLRFCSRHGRPDRLHVPKIAIIGDLLEPKAHLRPNVAARFQSPKPQFTVHFLPKNHRIGCRRFLDGWTTIYQSLSALTFNREKNHCAQPAFPSLKRKPRKPKLPMFSYLWSSFIIFKHIFCHLITFTFHDFIGKNFYFPWCCVKCWIGRELIIDFCQALFPPKLPLPSFIKVWINKNLNLLVAQVFHCQFFGFKPCMKNVIRRKCQKIQLMVFFQQRSFDHVFVLSMTFHDMIFDAVAWPGFLTDPRSLECNVGIDFSVIQNIFRRNSHWVWMNCRNKIWRWLLIFLINDSFQANLQDVCVSNFNLQGISYHISCVPADRKRLFFCSLSTDNPCMFLVFSFQICLFSGYFW